MIKKFHLYHDETGKFRLVEIIGGMPSTGNLVRGEVGESNTLEPLLESLRHLDEKLQWDGIKISTKPPKGSPENCLPLTPKEGNALAEFFAGLASTT